MPERPSPTWIIRPPLSARVFYRIFAGFMTVVWLLIATTAVSENGVNPALVWILVPAWASSGLFFNTAANQGARLFRDRLEMEMQIGLARIPLGEIDEVHLNSDLSLIMLRTRERYIYQSIRAWHLLKVSDQRKHDVEQALHGAGIEATWLSRKDEGYDPRRRRWATFEPGAIVATMMRPWVLGMAVAGAIVALLFQV
ncbi:hypothetical protein ACNI3K_09390 [Demequina sp. SO4-13]|uniref:hypothetical protein n=1 Tax=Demequina sp. SO4-13 TaxID=3401027 RepID=UPI003AF955BA